jgi:hypothetical protein
MLDWKDILIIGDSFCYARFQPTDWPQIIMQRLCNRRAETVRGMGFSGASWWSARKQLVEELEKHAPKLLIMTHTEMQRIPSDEDYTLNSSSVFNLGPESKSVPDEVLLAGQQFYKYLFCQDFYIWAQQAWFKEIDELVEKYEIPYVIHMHTFDPWTKNLHVFKNGITFDKPLWPLCDDFKKLKINESKIMKISETLTAIKEDFWDTNDTRNHFSVENNKKLASQILLAFHTYSNGVRELQL